MTIDAERNDISQTEETLQFNPCVITGHRVLRYGTAFRQRRFVYNFFTACSWHGSKPKHPFPTPPGLNWNVVGFWPLGDFKMMKHALTENSILWCIWRYMAVRNWRWIKKKKPYSDGKRNFKISNDRTQNSTAKSSIFEKHPTDFIGEHSVQRLRTRYSAVNAPATCCYSRTWCVHNCSVDCCCSGRRPYNRSSP